MYKQKVLTLLMLTVRSMSSSGIHLWKYKLIHYEKSFAMTTLCVDHKLKTILGTSHFLEEEDEEQASSSSSSPEGLEALLPNPSNAVCCGLKPISY